MGSAPKSIKQLISRYGFERILNKSVELRHLEHILRLSLDSDLQSHLTVCNWRNDELILQVPNSAFATRLRYQLPELIKTLQIQPELRNLKKIRIKINKNSLYNQAPSIRKAQPITAHGRMLLKEAAQQVKNPALQQALQKLADN